MDAKASKKHLADLVHGHHHPEEHVWNTARGERKTDERLHPARTATATAPKKKVGNKKGKA
jgi:hypothetical protein